jgi:thioredoxin 1
MLIDVNGVGERTPHMRELGGQSTAGRGVLVRTSDVVREVTDDSFARDVEQAEGLSMVDFWAAWCGPCHMMAPAIDQLAREYQSRGVNVSKMDVDAHPLLQVKYGVRSLSTILFFRAGNVVDRVVGYVPRPQLEATILEHL